jgi:hypothetical protein
MSDRTVAIVAAIATVAAIPVTLLVYRLSQERKRFDHEFISGVRLLANEATRLARELELRFRNNIIKDPYLLLRGPRVTTCPGRVGLTWACRLWNV